jgi:hypothetical protein
VDEPSGGNQIALEYRVIKLEMQVGQLTLERQLEKEATSTESSQVLELREKEANEFCFGLFYSFNSPFSISMYMVLLNTVEDYDVCNVLFLNFGYGIRRCSSG